MEVSSWVLKGAEPIRLDLRQQGVISLRDEGSGYVSRKMISSHLNRKFFRRLNFQLVSPWSSLVEGDEQLDQPNSQTTFWIQHKHNSFLLGPIQPSSPTTKELHG